MQLLLAHQILIGSAIVLAVIFGLRSVALFARGGTPADLALGLLAVAVAAALGLYLRQLRRRQHRDR